MPKLKGRWYYNFEIDLLRRFLRAILTEMAPKASLILPSWEIEGKLFTPAGKFFSACFSLMTQTQNRKKNSVACRKCSMSSQEQREIKCDNWTWV